MFRFSKRSKGLLSGIDSRLADLMEDALAVSPIDFGIPNHGGIRTAEEQAALFKAGRSERDGVIKLSKHQSGKAVDIYAYVNGKATWRKEYYYMLSGVILGLAAVKGLNIRFGGDWDQDMDFTDQSFNDLCHYEILD